MIIERLMLIITILNFQFPVAFCIYYIYKRFFFTAAMNRIKDRIQKINRLACKLNHDPLLEKRQSKGYW